MKKKRFAWLSLSLAVLTLLFLGGCGTKEPAETYRTMVYRPVFEYESPEEAENGGFSNTVRTETGYRYSYDYSEMMEDGYHAGVVLVETDAEGNVTRELPLTEHGDQNADMLVVGERGLYVFCLYYDEALDDNYRALFRYSFDGQREAGTDVTVLRGKGNVNDYPKSGRFLLEREEGIVLIWDSDCIFADDTLTRTSEFELPGDACAAFVKGDDLWIEYRENGVLKFGRFTADGTLAESYLLPDRFEKLPSEYRVAQILSFEDGYLTAWNESGIFRWKLTAEEEAEPVYDIIMNFLDAGITGNFVQLITQLPGEGEGEFMVAERTLLQSLNCTLSLYRPDPTIDLTSMETLTLACIQPENSLMRAVVEFNQSRSDLRIEVIDYSIYNTNESWNGSERLMLDLTTGKLEPDLLFIKSSDFQELAESMPGYFIDLYTLMNGTVTPDTIYGCVRNTLESEDGCLYGISPEFRISTLVGRRDVIGDASKWSLTEFLDLYDSLGNGEYLMEEVTQSDVDYQFFRYLSNAFFVRDGQADFGNPEFIRLLEFTKSLPTEPQLYMDHGSSNLTDMYAGLITEDQVEIVEGGENLYHNGKIKLDWLDAIQSPANYMKAAYTFGVESPAELNHIGYPVDERIDSGVEVIFGFGLYTIPSCSDHAEEAWEFIEDRLTADNYRTYVENSYMQKISMGYFFKTYKPDYDEYLDELEGYQTFYMHTGERVSGWDIELDESGRYKDRPGVMCTFDRAAIDSLKKLL